MAIYSCQNCCKSKETTSARQVMDLVKIFTMNPRDISLHWCVVVGKDVGQQRPAAELSESNLCT